VKIDFHLSKIRGINRVVYDISSKETCFKFSETLTNIQKNIDELTNFLTFFKQLQLQIRFDAENSREAKEDKKLNLIAIIFTVTSILYVSSSFMQDLSEFLKYRVERPKPLSILAYIAVLVISYFLIKPIKPEISLTKLWNTVKGNLSRLRNKSGKKQNSR